MGLLLVFVFILVLVICIKIYDKLMGYKESYEAYINLSRKELQGLCKRHNLPANKCQSELAKSLASYFKKKNSSLVDTGGVASLVYAKRKSQEKTSDEDHGKNEIRAASPILVESSEEGINPEEAIDGITNNVISSTSDVVSRDQDLISQSPTNRDEQAPPLDPSSDNTNLNSQSPTKTDEQAPPLEPSSDNINLNFQSPTKPDEQAPPLEPSSDNINLNSQSPTKTDEQTPPLEPSSDNINLNSQSPTKTDEQAPPLEPSSDNINLNSQSPTKTDEQAPPLEPSSDIINQNSQSPTKCQNHVVPTATEIAVESPIATEIAARPASFQLFVASDEGINLFVDLNSGPSDWAQTMKDEICMNPITHSASISNLVKDTNSSLSSVLSENIASESAPLESTHNLADMPTHIENKLAGIQEGDENDVCEISVSEPNSLVPCQNGDKLAGKITDPLTEEQSVVGPADKIVVLDSATAEGGSKEVCEISMSEPNSLVPCQNSDKLAGKITDPLTEELSVVGPTDKVVFLDSATDDSLLSSSDMLDDISVSKASDNSELTPVKKLKRALNQGSDELSQNRKHHVVHESNKRNYMKILRSSSALVKDAHQDNSSVRTRRSQRLVPK
ncbi:hypothetical protein FCM35_KLT19181 [Carex littledalei]|uniref:SAP domain-containing protein n=1 Tax=Carex littledalei TaxID=544730 RepID=A0A833R147_9POAL|nr:hypothetical protein FCM35_KLT19181 [Carex littledalei]